MTLEIEFSYSGLRFLVDVTPGTVCPPVYVCRNVRSAMRMDPSEIPMTSLDGTRLAYHPVPVASGM